MAKYSLKYNQKPNDVTFIFVTIIVLSGPLVKPTHNRYKAVSYGKTFDLDSNDTKIIKDKPYVIIINDGNFVILGNAKFLYNKKIIDVGMADVITPLDNKYL